jgi:hypothetical protein
MADKSRVQDHAEHAADIRKQLNEAIKAQDADSVARIVDGALETSLLLATQADALESQLDNAVGQIKGMGKKALSAELRVLVEEKVAAGLPYDQAVEVALRQAEVDKASKK